MGRVASLFHADTLPSIEGNLNRKMRQRKLKGEKVQLAGRRLVFCREKWYPE